MTIVCIEGPDGVGKSTLAVELSDRMNAPVYRSRAQFTTPETGGGQIQQDGDAMVLDMALLLDQDVIVDRWFPSEWVYDHIFERDFDEEKVWAMDRRMAFDADYVGVMLYYPADTSAEELQRRDDGHVSVDKLWQIQERYRAYLRLSSMRWLELNALREVPLQIESVMRTLSGPAHPRPLKARVYMNMAKELAKRSTCLARRMGCVLTDADGHVIATGYNGAPKGIAHPNECVRLRSQAASSTQLENCEDCHAEENAIAFAAQAGSSPGGGTLYTICSPCHRCARLLINAGVKNVVYERVYDSQALSLLQRAKVGLAQLGGDE